MPFRHQLPGERTSSRIAKLSSGTGVDVPHNGGCSDGGTDALMAQLLYEAEHAVEKSKSVDYDWKAEMTTCLQRLPSRALAEVGPTFPFTRRDSKSSKPFRTLRQRRRTSNIAFRADDEVNAQKETRSRAKNPDRVSSEVDDGLAASKADDSLAERTEVSPSTMELRKRGPKPQAKPVVSGLPTPPDELRAADDVCFDAHSYILAIRIYECQKRPQVVARDLHMWEQRHEIAALTSPQDDEYGVIIPDDAVYLIVLQHITWDPNGSVLFFASKQQQPSAGSTSSSSTATINPMAPFDLKVGYYYDYRDSIMPWIDTVIYPNAPFPLLEAHSIIRPGITPKEYKQFYNHCRYTIHREYQAYVARPPLNWPSFAYEWVSARRKEYVDSRHIRDALVQQGVSFEVPDEFD